MAKRAVNSLRATFVRAKRRGEVEGLLLARDFELLVQTAAGIFDCHQSSIFLPLNIMEDSLSEHQRMIQRHHREKKEL
ncbi:LOW QUALITY PROTEIN: hypothetical protein MC885_017444 [Smutsia gigantea]|nr:LOW QUALITY PROTEIN: hypothetical protein MC885_017444 [Smutsia gigantea]